MAKTRTLAGAVLAMGVAVAMNGTAFAAEAELRFVTATSPQQVVFCAKFIEWTEAFNKKAKGIVQFKFIGGPEAIPPPKQPDAVKNGVVDAQWGPIGYYLGQAPVGDAMYGSNVTPEEARKNGGLALMDEWFQKHLNAKILGWFSGGVQTGLYLRDEPKIDDKGGIRLEGFKVRSTPDYKTMLERLGATLVAIPPGEIYTALERNLVQGVAYTTVGTMDTGWDKFLKYRIEPHFNQIPVIVMINLDKWNALSKEAKDLLTKEAAAEEIAMMDYWTKQRDAEIAELTKRGMKLITLKGDAAAKFQADTYGYAWDRLQKEEPELAPKLKAKFWKEG